MGYFNMDVKSNFKNVSLQSVVRHRLFWISLCQLLMFLIPMPKHLKATLCILMRLLMTEDADKALVYAQLWLESISEEQAFVTQENCIFCHSVEVTSDLRMQIDE